MYSIMHYLSSFYLTQCIAPFVGNGMVCGRDSDGDGFPDMKLDCDDPQCQQVLIDASMIFAPFLTTPCKQYILPATYSVYS